MHPFLRWILILGLLFVSLLASIFMVLEAGSFYQKLYPGQAGWIPLGFLAAGLNEVFMSIMAGARLEQKGKQHPVNYLFRFLMVLLFVTTVGGASFNLVYDKIQEIQGQSNQKAVIQVLLSQVKDDQNNFKTFTQQRQRLNSALTARKQRETKEKLIEELKRKKPLSTLWFEIIFIVTLRFGVQLANLACVWLAGWIYRDRRESSPKRGMTRGSRKLELLGLRKASASYRNAMGLVLQNSPQLYPMPELTTPKKEQANPPEEAPQVMAKQILQVMLPVMKEKWEEQGKEDIRLKKLEAVAQKQAEEAQRIKELEAAAQKQADEAQRIKELEAAEELRLKELEAAAQEQAVEAQRIKELEAVAQKQADEAQRIKELEAVAQKQAAEALRIKELEAVAQKQAEEAEERRLKELELLAKAQAQLKKKALPKAQLAPTMPKVTPIQPKLEEKRQQELEWERETKEDLRYEILNLLNRKNQEVSLSQFCRSLNLDRQLMEEMESRRANVDEFDLDEMERIHKRIKEFYNEQWANSY